MAKTISQFGLMNPAYPEYTDNNHMYSISNVDPTYYLAEGVQEKQKTPLAASRSFQLLSTGISSSITSVIPSRSSYSFDIFTAHDDGSVKGTRIVTLTDGTITSSTTTMMGYVFGSGTGYTNQIAVFADKLVGTRGSGPGNIAYTTITSGGSGGAWTGLAYDVTLNPFNFIGNPSMVTFLDKLWISDSYGVNTMSNIRGFNNSGSAIVQDTSLVLQTPSNFSIQKMVNYKNKYLLAAATFNSLKSTIQPGEIAESNESYIFAFSGASKGYQFSIQVPGSFADMIMVDNVLKVLVKDRFGQYSLYHLSGETLIYETTISIDTPKTLPLISYMGMTAINLSTKGIYVYGKKNVDLQYILTSSNYSNVVTSTVDSRVYAISGTGIYCQQVTGTSYDDISAVTQYIPLDTKLTSIDVLYDTPPQSPGDYIRITATVWSEDQYDGVVTKQLNDITSTVYDTKIKTTLDVQGLTPSEIKLVIQTHSTGTWRPIIREIQLNESKQ